MQLGNDVDWSAAASDIIIIISLTHSHAAGNVVMENEDAESTSNSTPRYRPDGIEALCTATGQLKLHLRMILT